MGVDKDLVPTEVDTIPKVVAVVITITTRADITHMVMVIMVTISGMEYQTDNDRGRAGHVPGCSPADHVHPNPVHYALG
ncbi:hypothetical protein ACLKA7_002633 [Drosophila subpalustris]